MASIKTSLLLLGLLLMVAGCRNHTKTKTSAPAEAVSESGATAVEKEKHPIDLVDKGQRLKNKKWQLFIMNGNEKSPYSITLVFKDSTFGGMGVCNSYGGKVKYVDFSSVKMSQLSSTEMACEGLEYEQRFFQFLQKVKTYMVLNDTLSLYDERGMNPAMLFNVH